MGIPPFSLLYAAENQARRAWERHRDTEEVIDLEGELQVESYVHTGEGLLSTKKLDQEARERLAMWLKETYLNELVRGVGRVTPQKAEPAAEIGHSDAAGR